MRENKTNFSLFGDYFAILGSLLLDSKTGRVLTSDNHRKYIPKRGTMDALALPEVTPNLPFDTIRSFTAVTWRKETRTSGLKPTLRVPGPTDP
jgi:hypothetical protein